MSRNPAAQQNAQARIMKFLPLIFGVICIRFPAGVVLYYAASNVCRITQQDLMYRFDPKVKALVAQDVIEVEAKTRDIDRQKGSGPEAPPARTRFRELLQGTGGSGTETSAAKPPPAKGVSPPKGAPTPSRNAPRTGGTRSATPKPPANGKTAQNGKPASGSRNTTAKSQGQQKRPTTGQRSGPTGSGQTPSGASGTPNGANAPAQDSGSAASAGSSVAGPSNPSRPPNDGQGQGSGASGGRTGAGTPRSNRKRRGR
jgi:hypothetical protein